MKNPYRASLNALISILAIAASLETGLAVLETGVGTPAR